ncbi:MAG: DUF4340 domain-containing protein [Bacteroidota bacterium]
MRSKKLFFIALAVLALGILTYIAITRNAETGTLEAEDSNFAVADTAGIDKIFISAKSGGNWTLERGTNSTWTLNKTWEVAPVTMQVLLQTIHDVDIKRQVSKAEHNTVVRSLATDHNKVEIYVHGELLKTYFVGHGTDNYLGTYFLMQGSDTPWITYIPGFDGYLSTRYIVSPNDWREPHIFRSAPQSLRKVSVTYPGRPADSFTAEVQGKDLIINGQKADDPAKTNFFITKLRDMAVNTFYKEFTPANLDSMHKLQPIAVITTEDQNPKLNNVLKVYPWREGDNPGHDPKYNALLGTKEEAINIMKERSDFLMVSPGWFMKPKVQ